MNPTLRTRLLSVNQIKFILKIHTEKKCSCLYMGSVMEMFYLKLRLLGLIKIC